MSTASLVIEVGMRKLLWIVFLMVIMVVPARAQNAELGLKSLFLDQKCAWKDINFIEKGLNKRVSILGISASVRTSQGVSIFYEGLLNTVSSANISLDSGSSINGVAITTKGKETLAVFDISNGYSYNSFGVEYFLTPGIRPLMKVEQIKYSVALANVSQKIELTYNQCNFGIGLDIVQYSRNLLLQVKPVFIMGKNTSGWDIDISGRWYGRDLSAFAGVGYRYKDYTTDNLNYGISGPYIELGVAY